MAYNPFGAQAVADNFDQADKSMGFSAQSAPGGAVSDGQRRPAYPRRTGVSQAPAFGGGGQPKPMPMGKPMDLTRGMPTNAPQWGGMTGQLTGNMLNPEEMRRMHAGLQGGSQVPNGMGSLNPNGGFSAGGLNQPNGGMGTGMPGPPRSGQFGLEAGGINPGQATQQGNVDMFLGGTNDGWSPGGGGGGGQMGQLSQMAQAAGK